MLPLLVVLLLGVSVPAQAQTTYTVTTSNATGPGSLGEAIDSANNNPGADIITFSSGFTIDANNVNTSNFDFDQINEAVTIDGDIDDDGFADVTITDPDGSSGLPVFSVDAGPVTIEGIIFDSFNIAKDGTAIELLQSGTTVNIVACEFRNLTNTDEVGATGGAVYANSGNVVTIDRSIFTNVVQDGAGAVVGMNQNSDITITNSLFYENNVGVGIVDGFGSNANIVLRNVTFANNTGTTTDVSAINGASAQVYNSVLDFGTSVTGSNNIQDSASLFTDAANDDYTLASGASSAIDQGDNNQDSGSLDLAGGARVVNGTVDIGAYERGTAPSASAPSVATANPSGITPSTATLGGDVTADGGATVTDRGVVYSSTNTDPFIGDTGVTQDPNGSGTGAFSETISGLFANTTYYVKAYAINSEGTSYGSVQTFTTVNTAPTFTAGTSTALTIDEDASATSIASQLEVSDSDGGQTLTWSVASGPSDGTLSGFNATTGSGGTAIQPSSVTYTPNANYNGADSFDIQVSDGTDTDDITVVVTVNAINDRPTITAPSGPLQPTEDVAFDLTGANEIQVADIDAGIGDVELSLTANNGTLTLGSTSNLTFESGSNGTGTFTVSGTIVEINNALTTLTYQGNPDYNGTETIGVVINDRGNTGADPGISGDGSSEEATASIDVDVQPVPDDPTITTIPDQTTDEDVTLSGIGFTVGDAETAASNLTLSFSADTPSLIESHTFVGSGADRTLSITPADNQNGVLDVTVTVIDESGRTASDVFRLTINAVNDTPTVATNQPLSVNEGASAPITSTLLETTDPEDSPSDVTYAIDTDVQNGQLVNTATSTQLNQGATFTQADVNNNNVEYQHDGSETASDGFDFTVADSDGESATGTFSISISSQNDAPTISGLSDQTIAEDATLGPVSFTVGDAETAASGLMVTASSDNQTLVPDANITLGGTDANRTIETTPASNENGTATITVTVDDGSASNSTASDSFVLTVTAVPDLAIEDGGPGNVDFSGSVAPGTSDNPVGLFALAAGQAGASFEGLTVTNKNPDVPGISAARLYWSSDPTLEPGSDAQLDEVTSLDASSAPLTISFSGFSRSIPNATRYVILAIDVQGGASGDVRFELSQDTDLSVPGGEIATVNGQSASTFAALPLSNGATALPVELTEFAGTTTTEGTTAEERRGEPSIQLQWATASETGNAGFEVQRRADSTAAWTVLGFVEGAGTTDAPQTYRFRDPGVPFAAEELTYRLRQMDVDGTESFSEPVVMEMPAPQAATLQAPFPNPAQGAVTLRFALSEPTEVQLQVYDLLGRRVTTLAREQMEAGRHELQVPTHDWASGTYFVRMVAGSAVQTQRLTIVR